jgi:hypothetical protein
VYLETQPENRNLRGGGYLSDFRRIVNDERSAGLSNTLRKMYSIS